MLGELSAIKYIYISWTDLKVKKIAWPQNTAINIIYLTEVSQVEWHEAFDFPTSISVFNLGCGIFWRKVKLLWSHTSLISTSKEAGNNKSFVKKNRRACSLKWVREMTVISGATRNSDRDWSVHFDILHTLFCRWIHSSFVDFVLLVCFIMKQEQKLSSFFMPKRLTGSGWWS